MALKRGSDRTPAGRQTIGVVQPPKLAAGMPPGDFIRVVLTTPFRIWRAEEGESHAVARQNWPFLKLGAAWS